MTEQIPTRIPPSAGEAGAAGAGGAADAPASPGVPSLASSAGGTAGVAASTAAAAPTLTVGEAGGAGAAAGALAGSAAAGATATTWQYNKKVAAVWSINQSCNSWAVVEGIGWKKLYDQPESTTMALTIIMASAKVTQGPIDYREESDAMIHEVYAF
jgi:hypothetical protein